MRLFMRRALDAMPMQRQSDRVDAGLAEIVDFAAGCVAIADAERLAGVYEYAECFVVAGK
jgi:altronate dehydratase